MQLSNISEWPYEKFPDGKDVKQYVICTKGKWPWLTRVYINHCIGYCSFICRLFNCSSAYPQHYQLHPPENHSKPDTDVWTGL